MPSVSLHVLMSLYVFNIKVSKYKKCEKNEISGELHHIVKLQSFTSLFSVVTAALFSTLYAVCKFVADGCPRRNISWQLSQ